FARPLVARLKRARELVLAQRMYSELRVSRCKACSLMLVSPTPEIKRGNSRQQNAETDQGVSRIAVDSIDYYHPTDGNEQRCGHGMPGHTRDACAIVHDCCLDRFLPPRFGRG